MSLSALLRATGADDTGRNVPEKLDTLAAQQRALRERRQRAQMFPRGTDELPLPDGMERIETPRGVFHYDAGAISAEEITRASAAGRENEVLGLGPASKHDVMERAARGEPVATVVERDGAGNEVKAVVATPSTAAAAIEEMSQRRAPDSRIAVEPVGAVLNGRKPAADTAPDGALAELLRTVGPGDERRSDAPGSALSELLAVTAEPGFLEGVANTAGRGIRQAGQAIDAASLVAAAGLAEDAAGEPERVARERAEDVAQPTRERFPDTPAGGRAFRSALAKWQNREAEREERLRNNARFVEAQRTETIPGLISAVGRRQQEIEALPQSAAMQQWEQAEDLGAALKVLARNPVEVLTNLAVAGVASGAPALVGGAVGSVGGPPGTAAGAGLGSLLVEAGGKIVEELRAAGVDFQRPETVAQVLNDPERLAALREKAMRRGVPVALIDALSAGIAGRMVGAPGRTLTQRAGRGAAEVGIQSALGGAGEVAGSLAAGDEVSGKAVLEEMLGEVGGGAVEIATGAARDRVQPAEKPKPAEGPLARLLAEVEKTGEADRSEAAGVGGTGANRKDLEPVLTSGAGTKQTRGKPADVLPDRPVKIEASRAEDGAEIEMTLPAPQAAKLLRTHLAILQKVGAALESAGNLPKALRIAGRALKPDEKAAIRAMAEEFARLGHSPAEAARLAIANETEDTHAQLRSVYEQVGLLAPEPATPAAPAAAAATAQPAEKSERAKGPLARLLAVFEKTGDTAPSEAAGGDGTGPIPGEVEPVLTSEGITKRPRLGRPAEAIAAAINARPDDDFKADLSRMEGRDVDVVAQLARYAEESPQRDEDFAKFAERMTEKFGPRVQSYLPFAWDAVSGERPVRDLTTTENPLQMDSAWARAAKWGRLFWEGSADVLRRSGVRSLADAIDRHVDFADRNLAKAWSYVRPAVEPFQGLGGVARRSRAKLVFDEFEAFYRARENARLEDAERILAQAHPETRRLIAGVQQMFAYTGQENRRLGVRVRDKDGNLRPIGFLGVDNFPRLLREEIIHVLRDPSSNPQLWEQMRAELVQNRNVEQREDAGKFVRSVGTNETSNDHFGSLEKGRAARFPESWYEYRFEKVIPRYVAQWSERTAQIEAFGQKIAETDRDAFDVAVEMVRNPELRRYIEATRDHAYKVNRWNPAARKLVGNVTAATTGLLLGNPYSTLRNLVGGTAQTVNQFGVIRSIRALRRAWSGVADAEAAGALKADVADLLFHDDGSPEVRKAAGVALKLGGFSAAENFIRTHNFLTAKTFLRDALRAFNEDPSSRRSLQAVAFFRRHGADPQKLIAEKMRGPETEQFLRGTVRQAQGSYRYSQVPLFTDGPMGRFLLQFARWGTMATRFHVRHLVSPAIVGELVPVRGADGKVTMRRVRTLLPLLRSPFVAMAAGATTFALREALFGFGRSDAEWDEVFRAMDDDEQRGVALALNRMINDVVMGGTFGALSDYGAMLRDAAERSRFKNPIEPPAASILKETGVLAYKLAQQGTLSAQDYREWASRIVTAYRYGSALAYRFSDAAGMEWTAARRHQAEQDRRFVRNAGRRFAEEAGYDVPGVIGGLPRVTENSPTYDKLEDALLSGDAGEVRRVVAERLSGARSDKDRAERLRQLRTSALSRQPVKPGGQYGIEDQTAFIAWARRRLTPEDQRRIQDVQRQYFTTGVRAGLFPPAAVERYAPQR